jgi:DNA-binding FadR family transcriptional regulator
MHALVLPRRLHHMVVDVLLEKIVSGAYPPGGQLPTEPEIAAQLAVSRSVVREAMRVLDAKGLIEVRQGSGTRVTPPDRWDPLDPAILGVLRGRGASAAVLRDLLEARTIIECEVAALAAARRGPAELAALEAALTLMRSAVDDPPRFVTGDSAFHLTLLHAAGNRVLERMTLPMHELLSYAQQLTDAIPGVLGRALADHERIAGAVERQDPAAAREAMREHLEQTKNDIISLTEAR